jgi:nucleoside-diphosphate-sugar epimerase
VDGGLEQPAKNKALLEDCDAVVHSALDHQPGLFTSGVGDDLLPFLDRNLMGTIRLIQDARALGLKRFVFVSTCAVHDVILPERPLDETHPLWPKSHYGAHKAAVEAFVSSFGRGEGYPICALRPTGIYGLARRASASKWAGLIAKVAQGEAVSCAGGGKEVHAADVAKAVDILLNAPADAIRGQAFSCCDLPISERQVAEIAKRLSGSAASITETRPYAPKNQIETGKIRALGMEFGGIPLLERTIGEILAGL